jgi:pimeloyl-ACP methyl ester carboxylesterase
MCYSNNNIFITFKEVNMIIRNTPNIMAPTINSSSVASLEKVLIGGLNQTILIRGESICNPILLFLHGGPGTAQIGFSRKLQKELEKEFIVINWDQRGAGLSYSNKLHKEDMTINQLLNDTKELVRYLLNRFNQKKLFIVGHSWGSVLGILSASQFPQYIYSYIGVGQVADMMKGEQISYEYVVNKAKESNNTKALQELNKIGFDVHSLNYLRTQRKWLEKFGGSIIGTNMNKLLLSDLFTLKEYTLYDWFKFMKGAMFSLSSMWEEVLEIDFFATNPSFDIPIYICAGKHDYQTPFEISKQYFDWIKAPHKEFFWFEHSAHCPNFEEPLNFFNVCKKVKHSIFEN